jgi:cytochrome P450
MPSVVLRATNATERRAPGPQEIPLLGSLVPLKRDPLGFFTRCVATYGRVVRFHLGPRLLHLVAGADGVRHVLQDHCQYFTKGWAYDKVRPVLGEGLLTSEGDLWKKQRRTIQRGLHAQRIASLADTIGEAVRSMLGAWAPAVERGEPFDVAREMMALTLDIVGRALFGVDVRRDAERVGRAMTVLVEGANRRIMDLTGVLDRLPTRENRSFEQAAALLDRLVFGLIAERKRAGHEGSDLLSMLLEARDDAGAPMPDQLVRDEVMTILLAGHETTANALAWTFYLLGKHPDVLRKLRAELERVLEGRPPAFEDLPRLEYTTMVLEEAMRLYPPGWILVRTATRQEEIGGFDIPAGSVVAVCPYVLHRDPEYWPRAEEFDPERFAEPARSERPKYAHVPFSAGPRVCIGKAFAMMEMQIVLASVAQRYRLELVREHPVVLDPQVTLRPRHGVRVIARSTQ